MTFSLPVPVLPWIEIAYIFFLRIEFIPTIAYGDWDWLPSVVYLARGFGIIFAPTSKSVP